MRTISAFIALPVFLTLLNPMAFGEVKAYEQDVTMPTWGIGPPQVHSVFESPRDKIYPYTYNEILTNDKSDKVYKGVFLENEYIKVLVLPEIGGRLHGALDKTNKYEFFYWHKTVKPGLISMTGAWISGGIEWNFPHGHRPSGFMPVDHRIVRNDDGSATVWVGETEPVYRMRWLVGMTVFPGRSYVKCDYVFINPTNLRHSFQFWATAATWAGDSVQAQYPGDMVTGHGKHEFWNWPINKGVDLTWWKNSPNASSYFAFNNPSDWFGTYDHAAQAGTVHVASHHIMPGKKLWTWGSGPSGRIWEDILSDGLPAYFEPQAGAWSDNQPDYHWMTPHQVRTTHDFWYPVRNLRGFHKASEDFALNTDLRDGVAFGGVNATGLMKGYRVVLKNAKTGAVLKEAVGDIAPDKPFSAEVKAGSQTTVYDLHLAVYDPKGNLAIELQQQAPKKVELPPGQKDPGDPKKMNLDELYHAGEWLDRYRRTDEALTYYREALKRDPKDSRVNADMGFLALEQGKWNEGLNHLNIALERDADNARLYFGRGIAYSGIQKYDEARDEFYRATFGAEYFSQSYLNLARLDMRRGNYRDALAKLAEAEAQNARFADIPALAAAAHRLLGEREQALREATKAVRLDAMHFMGGYERTLAAKDAGWEGTWTSYMRDAVQNYLELAVAYAGAGLYTDADGVLARFSGGKDDAKLNPMVNYFRGYFKECAGNSSAAAAFYARARKGPAAYTNPHRLEGKAALESAIRQDPKDANARLFLGNLLYASGQKEEGLANWRKAVELDPNNVLALRNVGYAEWNLNKNLKAAYALYQRAIAAAPGDARVLLELDQVAEALKNPSAGRLAFLVKHQKTVDNRDDLISRVIDLRLEQGGPENLALVHGILANHHFRSWEGRYGIHFAWVEVNKKLGDIAFAKKDYQAALGYYQGASEYPKNLEVAPRTPDFRAHVYWDLAKTYSAMGQKDKAQDFLSKIVAEQYGKPHLGTFYKALAAKAMGRQAEYRTMLAALEQEARKRASGGFEYRGDAGAIGRYLLWLVLDEKGDKAAAAAAGKKAIEENPLVARLAIREAQLDISGAHQ